MNNILEKNTSPKITSFISTLSLLILLPLLLLGVYESVQVITRAFGTPANIIVNTDIQLSQVTTDHMRAFAQGGEEATDMLESIIPSVKALKPTYIRIDHIYDYHNVVQRTSEGLSFDFSRLDKAVDSIFQTGATPVLALSYMPSAIAKDGVIINPPNNWDEWALVVQRTIEHYSGKNNKNYRNIYYEVWNEPDLAQFGSWKLTGEKNYLTLYRYAAQGARNAANTNPFFIGGPSTTGLYKNWIIALTTLGSRVDFFSWHSYLFDPNQFAKDQMNISSWLSSTPYYALLPRFVTEFGFTGAKDPRYSTMYAAAHTAAVFRQTATGGPQALFSFQLKDGPNQEDGWGMITHESKGNTLKPRYHVYSFLESMNGTRLELLGEGSWVSALATINNDIIRVLLINFNHQSSKSETVPVTFARIASGTYKYRERFLLGRDATFTEQIDNNTLKKEIFMPANSVAIIELTKEN